MLRVLILLCLGLSVMAGTPLPHSSENASWQEIRKRFSGDEDVKKSKDGKIQSLKVSGFKKDKKPGMGWARVSLDKEGHVIEMSSDRAGFTNEEYKLFKAFKKMKKLTLWHNASFHDKNAPKENYGGSGLLHLVDLPVLTHVTLAGGGIDDMGMKAAAQLPHLKYIGMWHVPAGDEGLTYLKGHKTLEELKLGPFWGKLITDKGVASLAECPNFKKLRIGETWLTYDGIKPLEKLKGKLEVLDFHNSLIEADVVSKLKGLLPGTEVKWEGIKAGGKILNDSGWHLGKAKKWMPAALIEKALAAGK